MKKVLIPLLIGILFSGSYIAAKYATFDLGPLTTTLFRYFIALIFLSVITLHFKSKSLKIKVNDWWKFVLLGIFGIIGYHFFFFTSLRYTTVANTGVINAFSPAVTGILAALFLKERLSKRNYFGVGLALFGVLVLVTKGNFSALLGMSFNLGDLLMLLSVISWAVYALIIKWMSRKYHSFTLTFYATLAAVIILVFMSFVENTWDQLRTISTVSTLSVIYMGLFASGIGYLLYNYSIKEIGPTKTSSFVYSAVPILVAILAFLFFKEVITIVMVVSIAFIITGLHLALSEKK